MTIDIVDLTDPAYQGLNATQLSSVREAQAKKNELTRKYRESVKSLFYHFVGNNTAHSSALDRELQALGERLTEEVDALREELLEEISREIIDPDGNEYGPYSYPENPNYSLNYSQRFLVVRSYYMKAESNAYARLEAYKIDSLARTYLGDYYQTLYDLLASYV